MTSDEHMNHDANELLRTADTILLGRIAYQAFVAYWPFADTNASTTGGQIARQINEATKVVFSRTLESVTWGTWNNARLIKEHVGETIADMKAQSGKNLLLYAGATIASTFIQQGFVDEYRLRVHPVVLGSGKPLFKDTGASIPLTLVQTISYHNGVVLLHYQPSQK